MSCLQYLVILWGNLGGAEIVCQALIGMNVILGEEVEQARLELLLQHHHQGLVGMAFTAYLGLAVPLNFLHCSAVLTQV